MSTSLRAPLILASQSPRRIALLEQVGLRVDEIKPMDIDETPFKNENPARLASRLASQKALAALVSMQQQGNLPQHYYILAADTVVARGRIILPKPENMEEAKTALMMLSGRTHKVFTSVALLNAESDKPKQKNVETRIRFKRLSKSEIEDYIASGEWRGKAGGYAIQGYAASFVQQIIGSYTAVVGLPIHETMNLLNGVGYPIRQHWR